MNAIRIAAIVAIVLGALSLVYGGFTYTQEDTAAKLGPIELKVAQEKRLSVPVWAGAAAIVAGALVLVGTARRR